MRETVLINLPQDGTDSYSWCLVGGPLEQGTLEQLKHAHPGARLLAVAACEHVSLCSVNLPVRQASKLVQAVPYALEDQIAADVDGQHFALGPRQPDGRTPVAVVNRSLMDSWLEPFLDAGVRLEGLIPDVMLLPQTESMLTLFAHQNGRCVVRKSQFDGFACDRSMLSALLDEEDKARAVFAISALEAQVPEGLQIGRSHAASSLLEAVAQAPSLGDTINLLQSAYAPKRATDQWLNAARWPMGLAAACLIVSVLSLFLDNAAQEKEYERLQDMSLALFEQGFPYITRIVDPRIQAEQALARMKGGHAEDRFLTLMSESVPALSKVKSLQLNGMNFREGALYLSLSGDDLQALEQLRAEFQRIKSLKLDVQSAQAGSDGVQIRLKVERA